MNRNLTYRRGFTLLEIIVTLTILSVLGVMVYQFMGSSLIRSVEPFSTLAKTFVLREVAENITADYLQSIPRNVPALKTSIGAEGSAHINDGYCPATADCRYTVVDNHYIAFDANRMEIPTATEKLLKVTIRSDQNETITMVFVQP
jgi:prepilin-type N-terminal cleavage/methylation domain-containing protein